MNWIFLAWLQLGPATMSMAENAAPPAKHWIAVLIGLCAAVFLMLATCFNPRRGHRD